MGTLLMPRHVLEGPLDGLRHVDEKLSCVGRSVLSEKPGHPAIEHGVREQRRDKARKRGPIFHSVGKPIDSGKILDIGGAEAGWRVVDTNGAFEAKLAGPVRETGDRDIIAEDIPASRSAGSAQA